MSGGNFASGLPISGVSKGGLRAGRFRAPPARSRGLKGMTVRGQARGEEYVLKAEPGGGPVDFYFILLYGPGI